MKFWGLVDAVVGLIERIVNRPAPSVDKDVAKKAAEAWERDKPKR